MKFTKSQLLNLFTNPLLFILVMVLSAFLTSCRKDNIDIYKSENTIERFFSLPENADPVLKRIVNDLKAKNDNEPFVEKFVTQEGYPIWKNAKISIEQSPLDRQNYSKEEPGDTMVAVPIVGESEFYVKDILKIRINEDEFYKLYEGDTYTQYGFNNDPDRTEANANDVLALIMNFEKEIFGDSIFKITDNRLFDNWPSGMDKPNEFFVTGREYSCLITIFYISSFTTPGTGGNLEPCAPGQFPCWNLTTSTPIISYISFMGTCDDGDDGGGWLPDFPIGGGGGGGSGNGTPIVNQCGEGRGWTRFTMNEEGRYQNICNGELAGPILSNPLEPGGADFSDLNNPIQAGQTPLINNDFEISDELNSIPPYPSPRLIGKSPCRGNIEDMQYGTSGNTSGLTDLSLLNQTDYSLFNNMKSLINACTIFDSELNTIGHEMIEKFRARTGGTYSNTILNQKVSQSSDLKNYLLLFGERLKSQLNLNNGNIDNVSTVNMQTVRPAFTGTFNKFHGLQITLNDTECTEIQLDGFKLEPDGTFSAKITVTIKDHFGLDKADVLSNQYWHDGFPSWWILQHRRNYIPFETVITVHKTIKGHL